MGSRQSSLIEDADYDFGGGRFHVHVVDGHRAIQKKTTLKLKLRFNTEFEMPENSAKKENDRLRRECVALLDTLNEMSWCQRYSLPELEVHKRVSMRIERVEKAAFVENTVYEMTMVMKVNSVSDEKVQVFEVAAHIATTVAWLSEGGGMYAIATPGRWKAARNGKPRKWIMNEENYMTLTAISVA